MMTAKTRSLFPVLVCVLLAAVAAVAVAQRTGSTPVPETIQASGTITVESTQGSVVIRVKDRGVFTLPNSGGFEIKGDDDRSYKISMDGSGNIVLRGRTVSIQSDRETTVNSARALTLRGSQGITTHATGTLLLKSDTNAQLQGAHTKVRSLGGSNKIEAGTGQVQVTGSLIKLN